MALFRTTPRSTREARDATTEPECDVMFQASHELFWCGARYGDSRTLRSCLCVYVCSVLWLKVGPGGQQQSLNSASSSSLRHAKPIRAVVGTSITMPHLAMTTSQLSGTP